MKAIVTVVGKDRVGIIASVCVKLAEYNVNVLDITQTVLQDYFTMMMVVDVSACTIPVAELVELLDLAPLLGQKVTTLSGGEKQRVAIARALILDPCLILADEPTGNLDPKNRDIIMKLRRHEHEKGRGIILITHDMEVAKNGDTVYLLEGGKLTEQTV